MKIAIFTDSYLPYNSGVVHSIQTLNEELSSSGQEVFIFAPRYPGYFREEKVFRFPSIPSPTNPDYYLALPFFRRVISIIETISPDIIHVHHPFGMGWTGMLVARRLGIPLIYTCHTLYEFYKHYIPLSPALAGLLIRKVYSIFCNHCDFVITPTGVTGDYLRQLGISTPIKTIPTGINIEEFKASEKGWLRQRYGIAPGETILLCVGRLGKEKNMAFIVQCFARINRNFPTTKLVLVGKGPQEPELKALAKELSIEDKVIFTGLLAKKEVINCYHDADLFIFASVSETQGLVVPEAKCGGLPVVAVRANGVSEMINHGIDGFLTEASEVAFTEKIKLLLQNETLRKKMAENARARAKDLSSKKYATRILEVYSALAPRRQELLLKQLFSS